MYLSNYLEEGILNTLRGTAFSPASTLYVRLFLTSPGEPGTGGTEVAYAGYDPQAVAFGEPAAEGSGTAIRNTGQLTFPTAPEDAGQAAFIGIYDNKTGGNLYAYGPLNEPLSIKAGEAPVLLAGELMLAFELNLSAAYKRKALNLFRGVTLTGIAPHLALFSGNPDAGGVELAGVNYARAAIPFASPVQEASGAAVIANGVMVATNRASTDWGSTNYRAIMDAASAGEAVAILSGPERAMAKGRLYQCAAGELKVGLN